MQRLTTRWATNDANALIEETLCDKLLQECGPLDMSEVKQDKMRCGIYRVMQALQSVVRGRHR